MSRPMSRMLFYVGIFFAIIFSWYGVKKILFMWGMAHYKPPAATILAAKVQVKNWQSNLTAVGTLTAINGVELSSEAAGIVHDIRFNSGQFVKKGDVVIVLDSHVEQAQLKDKLAKLKLAELNFQRDKKLFERKVSSQSALDNSLANLQEAQANVELVQAQIKAKNITAPFDGRIGIRQVNLGQYVSPGTNLVTLQSLDPLYVMFNLPERFLPNIYLHQLLDVSINFGAGKTVKGKITAINSKVDQTTRNVLIQGTIPNDKFVLYPGMFALVTIWFNDREKTIVVPQTAISYSLSGDYVFVIKNESKDKKKPQLKVSRRYVKVGERRRDEAAILDGLKANEEIVTSGQLKLQNGSDVVIDQSGTPL
jgi:membrane fusion protein, multidrug efflux system